MKKRNALCGSCHGTGENGLGLINWGPCDYCKGEGFVKINSNAKTMTLTEFLKALPRETKEG